MRRASDVVPVADSSFFVDKRKKVPEQYQDKGRPA